MVKKKKKKKPQKKSAYSDDDATETRPTKSLLAITGGGEAPDSGNRKNCHQCRQKTMAFSASCKATRRGKPCPHHFCQRCLRNRYGENAAAVAVMADWSCPKCRGICNCSFCMRKKGRPPTGILFPIARSSGYSSEPIDVDEEQELLRRRKMERDREIEVLKEEIAALEAALEAVEPGGGAA
ncbi:unnamed protein product [Spirodela intermedia]|uniref:RING-type domain-containing protein n=1 Tax=Spirodela intermedia TaxID=51605 RepID=A0A7I8KIN8_SPIIN|nr:unnamed protein product [Spirodela intermedia]